MGLFLSKHRYEFKFHPGGPVQNCNIYVLGVDSVHYIGFEDTGEGDISRYILNLVRHCISEKYPKISIDNFFFFQWFLLDKERGVEQLEFKWDGRIPSSPKIRRYCRWTENPFFQ